MEDKQKVKGSAKVMLSYDYCHFEVQLSSDQEMTLTEINELRRDAQRLADNAVGEYKKAKFLAEHAQYRSPETLRSEAENIIKTVAEPDRTSEQKAIVKMVADQNWRGRYDYDDDEEW